MTSKEELQELVGLIFERLPDDATIGDLIEEFEIEVDLQIADRAISEGRVVTLEEFERRTEPCLSK